MPIHIETGREIHSPEEKLEHLMHSGAPDVLQSIADVINGSVAIREDAAFIINGYEPGIFLTAPATEVPVAQRSGDWRDHEGLVTSTDVLSITSNGARLLLGAANYRTAYEGNDAESPIILSTALYMDPPVPLNGIHEISKMRIINYVKTIGMVSQEQELMLKESLLNNN